MMTDDEQNGTAAADLMMMDDRRSGRVSTVILICIKGEQTTCIVKISTVCSAGCSACTITAGLSRRSLGLQQNWGNDFDV